MLSNVEATLVQRYNFDVAPKMLQRCVYVLRLYDLTTMLTRRCVFAGYSVIMLSDEAVVKFLKSFCEGVTNQFLVSH